MYKDYKKRLSNNTNIDSYIIEKVELKNSAYGH